MWWRKHMTNVIAVLLALIICTASYLAFFDTNNPRVLDGQLRGEDGAYKNQFKPGENLYVYRKFCVDRVVTGDVDIEIINKETGEYFYLGNRATGARKGCSERTSITRLPLALRPGIYRYRATIQYNVNPLRTVVYEVPELEFVVVK